MRTKFEAYLLTERRVSINTFNSYKSDLDQLYVFLEQKSLSLERLTQDDLKDFVYYLYDLKLSACTISRKISTIKSFFNYLATYCGIKNYAKSLCFPKIEKKLPGYLTQAEISQLLLHAEKDTSHSGQRNSLMLYLLYVSGMRVSELVSFKISDIHFDEGYIAISGKGGRQRMVPLPQTMMDLLKKYLVLLQEKCDSIIQVAQKKHYLFSVVYNKVNKPISRQACWTIIKKICEQAGISKSVSPHQLRHSFATHMLEKGADLRSLQLLLGHENIVTVQVYTHIETSQLRVLYNKKHPRS